MEDEQIMETIKQYKVTLQHDNGIVHITVNATSEDSARNIIMDVERCPLRAILEVKEVKDLQKEVQENNFKKFKEKVNSMTVDEFTEFDRVMYRTFNFIWAVEELDIEEVNNLQANQKEDTLSMTSKELFDFFKKNLSMHIE